MRLINTVIKGLGRAFIVSALALVISVGVAQDKKNVALFPTGTAENVILPDSAAHESAATRAIELALRADERIQVMLFSRSNPSVRRALSEGTIPASMLLPPFTGRTGAEFRAVTLGRLMRAQMAVASLISSYRFVRATNTAHVILTVEAYDIVTGKILGVASFSAEAQGDDEKGSVAAAIEKAASAAATESIQFLTKPPKGDG